MAVLPVKTAVVVIVVAVVLRLDDTKQTVALAIRPRSEIQVCGDPRCSARPKGQSPEAVDRQRAFGCVFKQAAKVAVSVERHDGAASEVPDEQFIGMAAKSAGGNRQAPGRIHR